MVASPGERPAHGEEIGENPSQPKPKHKASPGSASPKAQASPDSVPPKEKASPRSASPASPRQAADAKELSPSQKGSPQRGVGAPGASSPEPSPGGKGTGPRARSKAGSPTKAEDGAHAPKTTGNKRPRDEKTPTHPLDEVQLPVSSVARIVKAAIPEVMVYKDAKAAYARAATIFILYVTAMANDICREKKRSTINAEDIMNSLKELEFETFIPQVEEGLKGARCGPS